MPKYYQTQGAARGPESARCTYHQQRSCELLSLKQAHACLLHVHQTGSILKTGLLHLSALHSSLRFSVHTAAANTFKMYLQCECPNKGLLPNVGHVTWPTVYPGCLERICHFSWYLPA